MSGSPNARRSWRTVLIGMGLLTAVCLTGCQSDFGGQTLPSPTYLKDDVQYFAPGPQFKLTREAAAMREAAAESQTPRR